MEANVSHQGGQNEEKKNKFDIIIIIGAKAKIIIWEGAVVPNTWL